MSSEVTFDLEAKASRLATLEASMAAPGFWDVPERARQAVEELRQMKRWTEPYDTLRRRANDAVELADLIAADPDPDLERNLAEEVDQLLAGVKQLELQNMLQGRDDARWGLFTIHPGAGGTESAGWGRVALRTCPR